MGQLPPLLSRKWGHLPYIKQTTPTSWSAACPVCGERDHKSGTGDPDRFVMYVGGESGSPRGHCRKCGYFAWADDDEQVTEEEREEWRRVAEETEARKRLLKERKLLSLQEDEWYWRFTEMTDEQRYWWRKEGIPDSLQTYMRLGYIDNKGYNHRGELHYSPALVIPYFDVGWKPLNVQYRLLDPVEGAGKYRFTTKLDASIYLTDPDRDKVGPALVVEGAKKALVTYLELVLRSDVRDYNVVAVPAKQVSAYQSEQLSGFSRIYLLLDPDAGSSPDGDNELAKAVDSIGRDRVYVLSLPDKVDDMINAGNLSGEQIVKLIKHARKA